MKNNILKASLSTLVLGIVTGFAFSGCSNSEDLADGVTPQDGMERVSFKISEKDFEPAEEVAGTRAAAQPQTELQDLGDGWQAEVSLVPDTSHREEAKAKTRSIYTPTHYTIQAYQGGVLKGQTKGTFKGSTFTPDAGATESIYLPHGSYDFVCFNDKVTANGTQFTVNRTDAGTARFTIKRSVLINQDPKQYIAFEMKHAGALVSLKFDLVNCGLKGVITHNAYFGWATNSLGEAANPAERLKCMVETDPNKILKTMIYDFSADSYTYPAKEQISKSHTLTCGQGGFVTPGTNVPIYSDTPYSDFWLPGTDCSNLKLTFTFGEIYGRSIVGKTITVPTHKLVEANKSYQIVVKLIMGYMYLYSDGTAGPRDKNPGKTPVGVVVDPYNHIAVALQDVKPNSWWGGNINWASSTAQQSYSPAVNYTDLFTNYNGICAPETSSPVQQALDNYRNSLASQGVTVLMPSSVYVPNVREFLYMGVSLGKLPARGEGAMNYPADYTYLIPSNAPATGFMGANVTFPSMDMTRFNKAFTDVGGTAPNGFYWTSTECKDGSDYNQVIMGVGGGYSFGLMPKNTSASVRPFIHY